MAFSLLLTIVVLVGISVETTFGSCEAGFIPFDGSCYFFSFAHGTFDQARRDCQAMRADLAKIETHQEFNFFAGHVSVAQRRMWIGLTDRAEDGQWKWVSDGSTAVVPFTWFGPGEPSNSGSGEVCVAFDFVGNAVFLNDINCSDKINYICEKAQTTK